MSNPDGVARRCQLRNEACVPAWTAIKLAEGVHERLLAQALLSFTVQQKLPFEAAPLRGLIVLKGRPGTGKTTLGRGLANQVGKRLPYTKSLYVDLALMNRGRFHAANPIDVLKRSLRPMLESGKYDFVLMDCPPRLGLVTLKGLRISDYDIIPTIPVLKGRTFCGSIPPDLMFISSKISSLSTPWTLLD